MASLEFQGFSPVGMQNGLAVAGTAVSLTLTSGAKVRAAFIQVFTAPIRFTVDGTTPTASVGHRADVLDTIKLSSYAECLNFKAIRETGTSASLEATFYV